MSPRSAVLRAGAVACIVAGCVSRIIAPPPPAAEPGERTVVSIGGAPITVGAHAARVLQGENYITRRFRSDSVWGFRASDSLSARLLIRIGTSDTTRVTLELWGRCPSDIPRCLRGESRALTALLAMPDADPGP